MNEGKKNKLIGIGRILGAMAVVGGVLAIGKKIKNVTIQL